MFLTRIHITRPSPRAARTLSIINANGGRRDGTYVV